jgi:GDPmannose 4,6-dehydratase
MKLKKALIFGITGQDGSYLSKYLLKKKYKVYGISRGKNFSNLKKLNILKKIKIYTLKKNSKNNIKNILKKNFNEIYFLGGQSNVLESFKIDYETYLSQVSPVRDILNFILLQKGRKTKFLFAGSC